MIGILPGSTLRGVRRRSFCALSLSHLPRLRGVAGSASVVGLFTGCSWNETSVYTGRASATHTSDRKMVFHRAGVKVCSGEFCMTIAHCPVCREQVTVPAGVQREAVVQCPLCKEEFPLGDVLSQLPPELIVVRGRPGCRRRASGGSSTAPPITVTYDESADSAETAADETYAPAFQFEGASASPRATRAIRNGRGRQPAGPLRHIVQIVLGGVVGIALAQVILWWIPANLSVSNRDLTGLGRKYGNYVPFLVPASIREEGSQQESTRIASSESPAKSSSQRPAPRKPSGRKSDIPDFPFAEAHLQDSAQEAEEKELESVTPEASVPDGSVPDGSASQLSQQSPARPNDELEDIAVASAKDSASPSADRSDATAIRRSNDGRPLPIDIPTVEPASPAEATGRSFRRIWHLPSLYRLLLPTPFHLPIRALS